MLFAVISAAFKSWPEDHAFQPEDPEHLRAYLFVKARHFDAHDIKVKHSDAARLSAQLPAAIKAYSGGKAPLIHAYPWGIRLFVPRSIAGHPSSKLFHAVSSKVYEVIEVTLNIPIEMLKRAAVREAA
jgi:hypothetical protein